jgi:uncharacterized membrane protein YraQ (UPF0718 family)
MDSGARGLAVERAGGRYVLLVAGLLVGTALALLALVDFRRGFLMGAYWASTPYFAFHPVQLLLFVLGCAVGYLSWLGLRATEAISAYRYGSGYLRSLILILGLMLVVDLFTYRGVAAARAAMAGKLSAGWLDAFGVQGWLRPVALSLSYLATVWHATLLGILLAGLAATSFSVYRPGGLSKRGLLGSLFGALYALPQPFCSCCASVIVPSLTKWGASRYFSLAFLSGAPMLNISTLILAVLLLPLPYAVTRLLAGVVVAVLVSYVVARIAERWPAPTVVQDRTRLVRAVDWYLDRVQLRRVLADRPPGTVAEFVSAWLRASWRIGIVLVPTLLIGSVVTSAVVQLLPPVVGNNWLGVVAAAVTGTLIMVSTWTEIPVSIQLINAGLTAPAATVLVTMPPVSVPCLLVLGAALGRWREAVLYAVFTAAAGILAGGLFLALGV